MKKLNVISLRIVREPSIPYGGETTIASAKEAFDILAPIMADLDREALWVICLNAKSKINCLSQVTLGTVDGSIANPREVFKTALLANAVSIIIAHNHPSGDPTPSREDHAITGMMREGAKVLGVKMLDHIVIGNGKYYSFAEEGILFQ